MSCVKKLCKIIHYSFCRKVFFRSLIIISYSVIFNYHNLQNMSKKNEISQIVTFSMSYDFPFYVLRFFIIFAPLTKANFTE